MTNYGGEGRTILLHRHHQIRNKFRPEMSGLLSAVSPARHGMYQEVTGMFVVQKLTNVHRGQHR